MRKIQMVTKRICALVICTLLVIEICPISTFAEEKTETISRETEVDSEKNTNSKENQKNELEIQENIKTEKNTVLEEQKGTDISSASKEYEENSDKKQTEEYMGRNKIVENYSSNAPLSLSQLKEKFPNGKYWNHAGNPGKENSKNNQDGYTSTPCPKHGVVGTRQQTCNGFAPAGTQLSWQCMGYAEKLGYDSTGYNPRNNSNGWNTSTNSTALNNLKAGDIVRYKNNSHSIFVTAVNGETVTYTDCNSDNHCIIQWGKQISKSALKSSFTYVRSAPKQLGDSKVVNNPIGAVDRIKGNQGSISVYGWAYDWDDINTSLEIHVYIGGSAGSGAECHVIKANGESPDLASIPGNHRFANIIETGLSGEQSIYVYAINIGSGNNELIGSGTVTIAPVNNPIGAVDRIKGNQGSISVYGWAYDWDDINTSLEIHVYIGGSAGSGAECHVIKANGESPDLASIPGNHRFANIIETRLSGKQPVYVYAINIGSGGNVLLHSMEVNISEDKKGPEISNCSIRDITASGYTVTCKVTDESGVDRVQFPTWTQKDGQDDIQSDWEHNSVATGSRSGDIFTYQVNIADHNNEGGLYNTHIYAYDRNGNSSIVEFNSIEVPSESKEVANGYCGDNLKWQLMSNGVLKFSGKGNMRSYSSANAIPWYKYRDKITSVELDEGITSIGAFAFYGLNNLTAINIPKNVTAIGGYAFK